MKVVINLELDYIEDKDVLFFIKTEPLITKCIKTMTIKKDKTDKSNDNKFDTIMNKGLVEESEEDIPEEENTEDSNLYIE